MTDDQLTALAKLSLPAPGPGARARALDAAMDAFDQQFETAGQQISTPTQECPPAGRPTSTTKTLWSTIMDSIVKPAWNIKLSTLATATGIVAVPLAAMVAWNVVEEQHLFEGPSVTPAPPPPKQFRLQDTTAQTPVENEVQILAEPTVQTSGLADYAAQAIAPTAKRKQSTSLLSAARGSANNRRQLIRSAKPVSDRMAGQSLTLIPPAPRITPTVRDRENYTKFEDNDVTATATSPVSTFSIDVDTASYARVRASLNRGYLPPKDMVRTEELINYFDYDYALPDRRAQPFKPTITIMPTPWNADTQLMHVGIKGFDVVETSRPDTNLVLLLDTSGSMAQPNKLPLLIKSFKLLLSQLNPSDTVSVVTYAGRSATILDSVKASDRSTITAALENLQAGGATAGAQGIEQAYRLAEKNFLKDGINRVMLATDGDFNVGISNPDRLKELIAKKRETGVFLSVFGFGQGNYNDALMQKLAQNGNGQAAYIDTLAEAQKALVEESTSTLFPIANDVKIQVEFNPAKVAEYRLIGYETRALKAQDFSNDKVDAGEIGAGHSVTAIYELTPVGSPATLHPELRYGTDTAANRTDTSSELGFLKLRYKLPREPKSRLLQHPVLSENSSVIRPSQPSEAGFAVAVAAFGQKMRGNPAVEDYSYEQIVDLALANRGDDRFGYRSGFIQLVRLASALAR